MEYSFEKKNHRANERTNQRKGKKRAYPEDARTDGDATQYPRMSCDRFCHEWISDRETSQLPCPKHPSGETAHIWSRQSSVYMTQVQMWNRWEISQWFSIFKSFSDNEPEKNFISLLQARFSPERRGLAFCFVTLASDASPVKDPSSEFHLTLIQGWSRSHFLRKRFWNDLPSFPLVSITRLISLRSRSPVVPNQKRRPFKNSPLLPVNKMLAVCSTRNEKSNAFCRLHAHGTDVFHLVPCFSYFLATWDFHWPCITGKRENRLRFYIAFTYLPRHLTRVR